MATADSRRDLQPYWLKMPFSTNMVEGEVFDRIGVVERGEMDLTEKRIALVADIVGSRKIQERIAFDEQLVGCLTDLSDHNPHILSPYTLIGDEVQAVFSSAASLFTDAVTILSTIHPVKMRFSYGVGTLIKPINPKQAIEMDGPAFYRARDGVNDLKETGYLFTVVGEEVPQVDLVREALSLVSHEMQEWNENRLRTLVMRQGNVPVKEIAEKLGISDKAVYKTIDAGALEVIMHLFDEIEGALDAGLQR